MTSNATSAEEYINDLPEDRKEVIVKIRSIIAENLPKGFEAGMGYGMLSYHVPHQIYPKGYHCNPKLTLPFINLASQKNFVDYTTWGFMLIRNYWTGLYQNFPGIVKENWIWGKVVFGLKV